MAVVEASVTRTSGAFESGCARTAARNRLPLHSSKAVMSAAVEVTGTFNYAAGKDVVNRGLNGSCVGEKTSVEIWYSKERSETADGLGGGQA
jgi:hypothetical protein